MYQDHGYWIVTVKEAKVLLAEAKIHFPGHDGRFPKDGYEKRVKFQGETGWLFRTTTTSAKTKWKTEQVWAVRVYRPITGPFPLNLSYVGGFM